MAKRLRLYRLDQAYAQRLQRADSRVMSVDASLGKEKRPFVGVVVVHEGGRYCIPLSSPKPKHQRMKSDRDFSKILDGDGKLIGVLNFNNMIPVDDTVLVDFDIRPAKGDSASDRAYKELLRDELAWCNDNRELIERKASRLYRIVRETPERYRGLVSRCCDFGRLEEVLKTFRR